MPDSGDDAGFQPQALLFLCNPEDGEGDMVLQVAADFLLQALFLLGANCPSEEDFSGRSCP